MALEYDLTVHLSKTTTAIGIALNSFSIYKILCIECNARGEEEEEVIVFVLSSLPPTE